MNGLNDKQSEACCYTDGPLLILAGAGSGKTRVITHRIAYLMEKCKVNPYNILAITFTNKAAKEMRERVKKILGEDAIGVWVSTFHSMCVRILRKHIECIGGTKDFSIYDTDEQKVVMKETIKYLNLDPKLYQEKAMLAAISKAKENYISPDDYERENAASFRDQQIAKIYREYQRRLRISNALDFDDLIYQTIFLFETNPDVLAEYQERFKHIMVDEYQDTNHTQFVLVKQLAAKYRNLCVVGDDDQSIYKFRGANIYNILNFEEEYPDAMVVKLEQNYRSTANILNTANAVIANNEGRKDKTLWTDKEDGEKITFTKYNDEYREAEGTVSKIKSVKRMGVSYGSMAILYRTNAQSRVLEEKLIYENVPYKLVGGTNFYARKEIRDIVAYLKVLANPSDANALKRIINVPRRGIGDTTVAKVSEFADNNGMSVYDALLDIAEIPGMSRSVDKINKFTDMMESIRSRIGEGFLEAIFDEIIEKTGYIEELNAEGTDEAKARIENIGELKNKVVIFEEQHKEATLTELLEEIALVADADEAGDVDESEKVTLMTLHSAKGLEFPYVFMVGMEDRLFPSGMSIDSEDPDALEEERRLCYVGITRAMEKLYMSFVSKPKIFSNVGYGRPKMVQNDYSKNNPYTKLTGNPSANPGFGKAFPMGGADTDSYSAGDTVKHIKFGKGVVKSITPAGNDKEIIVDFERVGEKRMFMSLVKMKKI